MADRRFFTIAAYRTTAHQHAGELMFHKRGIPYQLFAEIGADSWSQLATTVIVTDNQGTFFKSYHRGRWHGQSTTDFLVQ